MWRRKKNEVSYRKLSKKCTISTDDLISLLNADKHESNLILPELRQANLGNDLDESLDKGISTKKDDLKINLVSANDKDDLCKGEQDTMKNGKSLASVMKQSIKNKAIKKKPVVPGYVKFALEMYTQDMSIGQVADKYQKTDKQITDSISSYIRKKLPLLWNQIHSRLHGGKSLKHIPMYIQIAADMCVYDFSIEDIMKQYGLTRKQVYDHRRRINKNLPSLGKYII